MSADNLPRPSTPGPWRAPDNPNLAGVVLGPDGRTQVAQCAPEMVPVLLALPERIRRMDAVRAYCDVFQDHGEVPYTRGYAAACRYILALLDGEAGDE